MNSNPNIRTTNKRRAFTLIELLVVIAIIGLLATITLPALKGFGRSNVTSVGTRQILDDIAYARQLAISGRTTVYMMFVPTNIAAVFPAYSQNQAALRSLTNLYDGQYRSYALFADRMVGAQPGQSDPRFLTDWKRLPEGLLFAPYKFINGYDHQNPLSSGFQRAQLPFPDARQRVPGLFVPHLAFNSMGQLANGRDVLIPIAEGNVLYQLNEAGDPLINSPADVVLTPPNNFTNSHIRVNWLTGRARLERTPLP